MNNNFSLGEILRKIRLSVKMSQEEVALKAGITTAYYGLVERNQKNPTVGMLEKICGALNVNVADIFAENIPVTKDIDAVSMQILNQLNGKTDKEKEMILQIIKQILKLQGMNE